MSSTMQADLIECDYSVMYHNALLGLNVVSIWP